MLSKIYINGFLISVAVSSKIGHHFRKESFLKIEFNQNILIKNELLTFHFIFLKPLCHVHMKDINQVFCNFLFF
jgi:hypothetical protein